MSIEISKNFNLSNKIIFSNSLKDAWNNYQKIITDLGFPKMIYISSQYRRHDTWGDPKDALILSNHDDSYNMELFNSINLLRDYSKFKTLLTTPGTWTSWKQIPLDNLPKSNIKKLIKLNNDHNVKNGIQFSLEQISPESACVIMLTGHPKITQIDLEKIWLNSKDVIIQISKIFQLTIRNLPHSPGSIGPSHPILTTRQKEILNFISEGKSIMEISRILKLSTTTIDKHLRLARLNLDVSTTAQAVSKALTEKMLLTKLKEESS